MPLEKATKILKAYKDNNYKASVALPPLGYTGNNVRANSGTIIDTAVKAVVAAGDKDAILEFLGMSTADISREYGKVITQDKNYPAKLRALEPLLKKQGIQWDEVKQVTTVPVLNVTVTSPDTAQQSPLIELPPEHVAQYALTDYELTPPP